MNERTENLKYRFLLGTHTMMFCIGFGYAATYMQELGIADSTIGVVMSSFSVLGALLQLFIGRVADRSSRWNFRNLLLLLAGIQLTASLSLPLLKTLPSVSALCFGSILATTYSMLPLLGAISFFYSSRSLKVDFSIARGIGSTMYAVVSVIMGKAVVFLGTGCIPFFSAAVSLAIIIEACVLPDPRRTPATVSAGDSESDSGITSGKGAGLGTSAETGSGKCSKEKPLLLRYPSFTFFLFGMTVVMVFHNMNIAYFVRIIDKVGGDSGSLGIALGISAVVEIPSLFFYGKLNRHASSKVLLFISCVAFLLKSLLFAAAGSVGFIYVIQALSFAAFGLQAASKVYYAHDTFEEKDLVTGQALVSMTEAVGMVLGSLVGGFLIKETGVDGMIWYGALICGVGVALAATGLVLSFRKKDRS